MHLRDSLRFTLALLILLLFAVPCMAQTDLTGLRTALAPFNAKNPLHSESDFVMSGSKEGLSFTFREHLKIIAKRPGKFRAEVTQLSAANTPQTTFQVISDGVRVWTYQPGTKRYSVRTLAEFRATDNDLPVLGIALGSFYLGDGNDMVTGLNAVTKDNNDEVLKMLNGIGIRFTSAAGTTTDADALVYTMSVSKQAIRYRFLLNPATNALREIDLQGRQAGLDISISEKIALLSPEPLLEKTTFQFTPPEGAIKVSALSTSPF